MPKFAPSEATYTIDETECACRPRPSCAAARMVLDSLINKRVIEMYSAEGAKANVLEPTGAVGLKFHKPLDKTCGNDMHV